MWVSLDCIALRMVRYNDRHSILSVYTRQRGRMSLLVNAGAGREASRRRAMLMPGSRFTCIADLRDGPGVKIPPMRDVQSRGVSPAVSGNAVKGAVTLFIVDFLNTILRDSQADEQLFEYIDSMIADYGMITGAGVANFHIFFLVKLMHFLGIEPDYATYRRGYVFDMEDGIFRSSAPMHGRYLDVRESEAGAKLLRMNRSNFMRYGYSSRERNEILDKLMEYYTLHFASAAGMKSTDVLRSLFH